MNFTNLYTNNTNFIFLPPQLETFESTAFFHINTTGHYWRNSSITSISMLYQISNDNWKKIEWISEQESDEYDMLVQLSNEILPFSNIIGFNSTSFHLPYLEQKYRAYGLPSPFTTKNHLDLLKDIKAIGKQLQISTKLNNLKIFLKLDDELSEIECIASCTALFQYVTILKGAFSVEKTEKVDNEILFFCKTQLSFPADFRIHSDEFYLIGSGNEMKVKVKLYKNQLKLYYSNYKDHFYLPEEDMILHKSLASAIPKDKKVKATAENCYSFLPYSNSFSQNIASINKYLIALLNHYLEKPISTKSASDTAHCVFSK